MQDKKMKMHRLLCPNYSGTTRLIVGDRVYRFDEENIYDEENIHNDYRVKSRCGTVYEIYRRKDEIWDPFDCGLELLVKVKWDDGKIEKGFFTWGLTTIWDVKSVIHGAKVGRDYLVWDEPYDDHFKKYYLPEYKKVWENEKHHFKNLIHEKYHKELE